jgi:hypothetical protein
MTTYETRTVIAETPSDLKAREDRRDEELRLASFRYSETVMAGSRASFRLIEKPQQEQQ